MRFQGRDFLGDSSVGATHEESQSDIVCSHSSSSLFLAATLEQSALKTLPIRNFEKGALTRRSQGNFAQVCRNLQATFVQKCWYSALCILRRMRNIAPSLSQIQESISGNSLQIPLFRCPLFEISCGRSAEAHLRIVLPKKVLFMLPFLCVLWAFSEGRSVRERRTQSRNEEAQREPKWELAVDF